MEKDITTPFARTSREDSSRQNSAWRYQAFKKHVTRWTLAGKKEVPITSYIRKEISEKTYASALSEPKLQAPSPPSVDEIDLWDTHTRRCGRQAFFEWPCMLSIRVISATMSSVSHGFEADFISTPMRRKPAGQSSRNDWEETNDVEINTPYRWAPSACSTTTTRENWECRLFNDTAAVEPVVKKELVRGKDLDRAGSSNHQLYGTNQSTTSNHHHHRTKTEKRRRRRERLRYNPRSQRGKDRPKGHL